MILFKKAKDLHKWLDAQRKNDCRIGFVPTMGALHEGHISLIRESLNENDITVCSIFINPTQFNDPADLKKYPVTLDKDIEKLEQAGCDLLFLPDVNEIYPAGYNRSLQYDLGYLETILEGKYRPGHFQGVCMVVDRLLDLVMPGILYLGQKDYQQCMVITRLAALTGRTGILRIRICPTLREPDGLAMSSRNLRLNTEERQRATAIYQCLLKIKNDLRPGELGNLKAVSNDWLVQQGFRPDYVEIADAGTLETVNSWDGRQRLVALVAAYLNEVRLIDNMLLNYTT